MKARAIPENGLRGWRVAGEVQASPMMGAGRLYDRHGPMSRHTDSILYLVPIMENVICIQ